MKLMFVVFAMITPIGLLSVIPVQDPVQAPDQPQPTPSAASVPLLPGSGAVMAAQGGAPTVQAVELPSQSQNVASGSYWHSAQTVHVRGQSPFDKAFAAYQAADDDAAKDAARAELRTELDKLYDTFIENQSKQIDELEQRLEKLRTQLERRREAKSRMVELKLQMVLSQAEGLGFPDSWQQTDLFGGATYQTVPGMYGGTVTPVPSRFAPQATTTSPETPEDPAPKRDAPRGRTR